MNSLNSLIEKRARSRQSRNEERRKPLTRHIIYRVRK